MLLVAIGRNVLIGREDHRAGFGAGTVFAGVDARVFFDPAGQMVDGTVKVVAGARPRFAVDPAPFEIDPVKVLREAGQDGQVKAAGDPLVSKAHFGRAR